MSSFKSNKTNANAINNIAAKNGNGNGKGKRLMLSINDCAFDIENISSTDIDLNDTKFKNGNQYFSFIRYNYGTESSPVNSQLCFKTGEITLTSYGIPGISTYAKTDKDRSYIKLPFDKVQESCENLFAMFSNLDKWAIENKDKLFSGKMAKFMKLYDYQSIVRTPQEIIALDLEDDAPNTATAEKKEKMNYAKIKIDTSYDSGEVITTVFLREDGVPKKQNVATITDMAEIVTWQSTIQFIATCNKIWFSKSAGQDGRRKYGIGFKLNQIEVTNKSSSNGGSAKNDFNFYAFNDTVEVEEKVADKKVSDKVSKKAPVKADTDTDSESDSESDTDVVVQKAKDKDSESDSESSDSDSNIKNTKKNSSSDSDSDAKPVKPKSDSDSDSDSESEKEVASKKPVKKTAKSSK